MQGKYIYIGFKNSEFSKTKCPISPKFHTRERVFARPKSLQFPSMSKKRAAEDTDYIQPEQPELQLKKSYKSTGQDLERTGRSWIDDRAKRIWELQGEGLKPGAISQTLNVEAKLKKGHGCTGKEISDWIRYNKKSKKHGTNPVSLENNNLRVDLSDACMPESNH